MYHGIQAVDGIRQRTVHINVIHDIIEVENNVKNVKRDIIVQEMRQEKHVQNDTMQ
jgi:hypothetical protein